MNVEQIYDLYKNNINSILNKETLDCISNRTININGYSFVNRLLIYIQNKYATDVMSNSSWEMIGRHIDDEAYPIWVIDYVNKSCYYDPDTNEEITNIELNPIELSKAIKIGTIKKVTKTDRLKSVSVYNIKDTTEFDDGAYKTYLCEQSEKIKLSKLLCVCTELLRINCTKSEGETRFDCTKNTIYIGNDGFEEKLDIIIDSIYHQLRLDKRVIELSASYGIDKDTIYNIIEVGKTFTVKSLRSFTIKENTNNDVTYNLNELDLNNTNVLECFIEIMTDIYDYIEYIIRALDPTITKLDSKVINKANELLYILEANEALSKLRCGDI